MKERHNWYRQMRLLCLLLAFTAAGHAQKMRLNFYGSYVLDGTYQIYYKNGNFYEGTIHRGLQLGLGTEYLLSPNFGVEFNYLKRATYVFQENAGSNVQNSGQMCLHYLLLGINAYPQKHQEKLQVFGGFSAGIVVQAAENTGFVSDNTVNHPITKFAWAARLGGICWVSDRVGVKLQTQWLSSLQFRNGEVNFDVHRVDVGPADYSIAYQFEIGSGVVVKLGQLSAR